MVRQLRRGEQAQHVGADRVEGDVAEVEQAGVADHDVQPERQQDVEQRDVDDADPGVARICTTNGRMQSSTAPMIQAASWLRLASSIMPGVSCTVRHPLAEQARRPQGQDQDQHDEGEDVLVVAAEHAAGQVADVAGAKHSIRPSRMPPTIAPGMLPMPPNTAAVNAFSPGRKPIVSWTEP